MEIIRDVERNRFVVIGIEHSSIYRAIKHSCTRNFIRGGKRWFVFPLTKSNELFLAKQKAIYDGEKIEKRIIVEKQTMAIKHINTIRIDNQLFERFRSSRHMVPIWCYVCKKSIFTNEYLTCDNGQICENCFTILQSQYDKKREKNNYSNSNDIEKSKDLSSSNVEENCISPDQKSSQNKVFVFDGINFRCPDGGHGLLVDDKIEVFGPDKKALKIQAKRCLVCGRLFINSKEYEKRRNELKEYLIFFEQLDENPKITIKKEDDADLYFNVHKLDADLKELNTKMLELHNRDALNKNGKKNNQVDYSKFLVTYDVGIWKTANTLRSDCVEDKCPDCEAKLIKSRTYVPVDNEKWAIVPGKECRTCKTMYIQKQHDVFKLLRDNKLAKNFTLDGRCLCNYSKEREMSNIQQQRNELREEKQQILDRVYSSTLMISVYQNSDLKNYIIIRDKKRQDITHYLYHYSDEIARELLTAGLHYSRKKRGVIYDTPFEIEDIVFSDKCDEEWPLTIAPSEIVIKRGGGLFSYTNSREKIVEVLLYAPFTKRYEIIRATISIEQEIYIDSSLLLNFAYKYGKPDVNYKYSGNNGDYKNWDELNPESLLKIFGYSVSQDDGLSSSRRHKILEDIVDLQIMSVTSIVHHLDFCIKSHPADKYYYARMKWKEDQLHISNYRVNPDRFLIASY